MVRLLLSTKSFHFSLWYDSTAIYHQHKCSDTAGFLPRSTLYCFNIKFIIVNCQLSFNRTLIIFISINFCQTRYACLILILAWAQLHLGSNSCSSPYRRLSGRAINMNSYHPKIILTDFGATVLYYCPIIHWDFILLSKFFPLLLINYYCLGCL